MMKTLGNEFSKQSVEQFNLSYKQMKNFYTTKEEKMAEEHLICCVKKRKKLNMSSCCGENEKENKKKHFQIIQSFGKLYHGESINTCEEKLSSYVLNYFL